MNSKKLTLVIMAAAFLCVLAASNPAHALKNPGNLDVISGAENPYSITDTQRSSVQKELQVDARWQNLANNPLAVNAIIAFRTERRPAEKQKIRVAFLKEFGENYLPLVDEKGATYHGIRDLVNNGFMVKGKTITIKAFAELRNTSADYGNSTLQMELNSMQVLGLIRIDGDQITVLRTIDIDQLDAIHGLVQHIITAKEAGTGAAIGLRYYDFSHLQKNAAGREILARVRGEIEFVLNDEGKALTLVERAYRSVVTKISRLLVRIFDNTANAAGPVLKLSGTDLEGISENPVALVQGAANLGLLTGEVTENENESDFIVASPEERKLNPWFYSSKFARQNDGKDIMAHIEGLSENDVPVVVLLQGESMEALPKIVLDAEKKEILQIERIARGPAAQAFARLFGDNPFVDLKEVMKTKQNILDNKAVIEASATLL